MVDYVEFDVNDVEELDCLAAELEEHERLNSEHRANSYHWSDDTEEFELPGDVY